MIAILVYRKMIGGDYGFKIKENCGMKNFLKY